MLHYRHPDVLDYGKYIETFSERRRAPLYTIGRSKRDALGRGTSAGSLSGCSYRYSTDFVDPQPQADKDQHDARCKAGHHACQKYAFAIDSRIDKHGMLKGISPEYCKRTNPLGPGHYPLHPVGTHLGDSRRAHDPAYTMNKAKETAEQVRARKKATDNPGPGVYEAPSYFDEVQKEQGSRLEQLAKRQKHCWAADQYSHMFNCMRPANQRGGAMKKSASAIAVFSSSKGGNSSSADKPPGTPGHGQTM